MGVTGSDVVVGSSSSSEREQFLAGLMRQSLDGYERGDFGVAQLVSDVESVIEALLEISDPNWVEELRTNWSRLEIIYATALDQGHPGLSNEEQGRVAEVVSDIRSVLDARNAS